MKISKFASILSLSTLLLTQPVVASASEINNNSSISPSEIQSEVQNLQIDERAELREMWDLHTVEVDADSVEPFGVDPGFTGIGAKGDILIALDSITDHVGLVKDSYTIIESHPDNPDGNVAYRDNNWKSRYTDIKGMHVTPATTTNKNNAVSYAANQIGEPYKLSGGRWSEDSWYCSKLVWRAYYNQDIDLEGRNLEARGTHVTPGDILDSPHTSVFYSSK